MEQLKKAIQKAIIESGFERAIQQEKAVSIWGDVVGDVVSKVTNAISVDKGVLVVKTKSATWRQELYMQKKDIIDKINKKIGSTAIKEIRFI
jgi:predicted nucleic acid-binding Zn ribbon protein